MAPQLSWNLPFKAFCFDEDILILFHISLFACSIIKKNKYVKIINGIKIVIAILCYVLVNQVFNVFSHFIFPTLLNGHYYYVHFTRKQAHKSNVWRDDELVQ